MRNWSRENWSNVEIYRTLLCTLCTLCKQQRTKITVVLSVGPNRNFYWLRIGILGIASIPRNITALCSNHALTTIFFALSQRKLNVWKWASQYQSKFAISMLRIDEMKQNSRDWNHEKAELTILPNLFPIDIGRMGKSSKKTLKNQWHRNPQLVKIRYRSK